MSWAEKQDALIVLISFTSTTWNNDVLGFSDGITAKREEVVMNGHS